MLTIAATDPPGWSDSHVAVAACAFEGLGVPGTAMDTRLAFSAAG